jgi:hypothetical protein
MMFFDTRAALAKIEKSCHPSASSASSASFYPCTTQKEANEAKEAAPMGQIPKIDYSLIDAIDAAEERAAIAEYEGGLSRTDAEAMAIAIHGPELFAAVGVDRVSLNNLTFALIRRLRERRQQS